MFRIAARRAARCRGCAPPARRRAGRPSPRPARCRCARQTLRRRRGRTRWHPSGRRRGGRRSCRRLVQPNTLFGAGIARDHPFRIVGGMLRQRLDGDGVARGDLELRRQRAAEIAPMHARRLRSEDDGACVRPFSAHRMSARATLLRASAPRLMRAELRQRILRPAALTGDRRAATSRARPPAGEIRAAAGRSDGGRRG